ncbi:hypothetical protein [Nonomuraea guangzhouensis]|uniref:Uncharacterized protein n=1 Tax=Nonomuraea guangzhouensis TaxID=1291555 RepID=A0ABW4G742_9ACTN|nr:hypothetical protein [Nonomuraea guangzhouensis]
MKRLIATLTTATMGVALALCLTTPATAELTKPQTRLIDFQEARVIPGIIPNTFILVVSGEKPYLNMRVELVPLRYVHRPDYWGIEVTGRLPGIGLPVTTPYTASLPLDGIIGYQGIEVIGATSSKRIDVPST